MKYLYSILFLITIFAHQHTIAQLNILSFESIELKMKDMPKPIVVFIHTNWCIYCQNMKSTTFKNTEIIQELNDNYYFISLDAENRETIHFLNNSFHFIPNGNKTGVHQLAKELATVGKKISYPTLTILNTKYEIILQQPSFISAKQLIKILNKISKNDV